MLNKRLEVDHENSQAFELLRSEKCVLIGYSNYKKGYKLFNLDQKQIVFSRDVKFFKDIFPFKQKLDLSNEQSVLGLNNGDFFNLHGSINHSKIPYDDERSDPNPYRYGTPSSHFGNTFDTHNENEGGHYLGSDASASEDDRSPNPEDNVNNTSEGNGPSFLSQNDQDIYETHNLRSFKPKSFEEAAKHQPWIDAMNSEMDALYRNNDWDLVELPKGRKAIGSKWGIDFNETFSHVVKIVTVRSLINLVVQNGWTLYQIDVNNAFLYGDLNETVYMSLPPGYFSKDETRVYNLNKSLYGLKQAPRQWNSKLTSALIECDDIIITGNNLNEINKKYCLDLIDEFGLLASKPSYIPMQPNISLSSEPKDDDPLLDNVTDYQKLIAFWEHLDEKYMIWIQIGKKWDKNATLQDFDQAMVSQCVETASKFTLTPLLFKSNDVTVCCGGVTR
ncbi:ribonuclease H-like domain-containing protein [Tanacetum coccineum]